MVATAARRPEKVLDVVVELNYIDSISYETVRRVLKKKRNQALEKERVGHSARAKC